MTHKSQLKDPLYKHWIKGGLASKYLTEGIEHMINNALLDIQTQFLSDICNHLSLTEAKCTDCTTANCLHCPTSGICNNTGKGRDKKCSYHVKGDPFKEFRKCPNDICDSLHTKIISQHRYGRPAWQNTDATKWCMDHWEIAKCFLPGSGYADKTSVEDIDCSGLIHLAINCLDVQKHMDLYLDPPNGIFSQILAFRNKIFHSASLSLTADELEEHIDLMIIVLQDKKELEQDPQAQIAVLKLEQLKDDGFFMSTKDEEEIRQENDYLGRKQEAEIRYKLTPKELEVALKVGILSQSKVVGKTLTRQSSLSFLHKTIQEYLAAVYLCSSAEGHIEAIKTYAHWYVRNNHLEENVRLFVFNINRSTLNELCKHFAKYDVLSGNQLMQDMIEDWTLETSVDNSYMLYGAVLTDADQQSLEIKQSDFLHICRMIPNEDKNDDEIIDIENTLTWFPESQNIPTDRLRTVQLLRVNIKSAHDTELCKIDLSHCKHLEEVSFRQMNYVNIILNYANITDIILISINTSEIHVIKTAAHFDSLVKQVKIIDMRNSESCKLFLPAVLWKIDMLNVIDCENIVIQIDQVMDTSLASRHIINTANFEIPVETDNFKMELRNELKIDTLNLHSDILSRNINIRNPSFAYIASSFIVQHGLIVLPSESWCQIAQNNSPTCLTLKSNSPNHKAVAEYIVNMKQLVKLHINVIDSRDGTLEIMRSLKSLPRLEDLGLVIQGGTEYIVAEHLPCMIQLKRLKLYLEYGAFDDRPSVDVHVALYKSISKLSNIEKLELKCNCNLSDNCFIGQILLHSLPYLSKLKHLHLHFGLPNKQFSEALSTSLPKMGDLESLYLTNDYWSLEDVLHSMIHLTKLKLLRCLLQNEQDILALSKSVLTMTNLETLDISLIYPDNETLSSLQGLPQLTHLKCVGVLEQDNTTALLISQPKLVNLETLSVELDCDDQSANEVFTKLFSLNGHLQLVIVKDSSMTGCGVMPSSIYTAKHCPSYTLDIEEYDYTNEKGDISTQLPYWELKRKQENK